MRTDPSRRTAAALLTTAAAIHAAGQSDPSLFDTVINVPDDTPVITGGVDDSTQLNVYTGGLVRGSPTTGAFEIGPPFFETTNTELNLLGGVIDPSGVVAGRDSRLQPVRHCHRCSDRADRFGRLECRAGHAGNRVR